MFCSRQALTPTLSQRERESLKRQMTNGNWLVSFLNFFFKRGTGKR